jgi:hypothetical protein
VWTFAITTTTAIIRVAATNARTHAHMKRGRDFDCAIDRVESAYYGLEDAVATEEDHYYREEEELGRDDTRKRSLVMPLSMAEMPPLCSDMLDIFSYVASLVVSGLVSRAAFTSPGTGIVLDHESRMGCINNLVAPLANVVSYKQCLHAVAMEWYRDPRWTSPSLYA